MVQKRNTSDVESASGLYRSNTFFKKGRPAYCRSCCTRSSRRQASFTMNRRAKTRFLLPSLTSIKTVFQIQLTGFIMILIVREFQNLGNKSCRYFFFKYNFQYHWPIVFIMIGKEILEFIGLSIYKAYLD